MPAARGARFQLDFVLDWIPAFGTHFALGIDGIALVMIAMIAAWCRAAAVLLGRRSCPRAAGIGLLRAAAGHRGDADRRLRGHRVFLFYVFFEAMLIPMYFLIGRFGGPRRQYAAVKFFLYSLFGGLIMLAIADRRSTW